MVKKILFVVPRMPGIGGIESSLINLLNTISKDENLEIDLCVLANQIKKREQIPKNVKIIPGSKFYEYSLTNFHENKKKFSISKKIANIFVKLIEKTFGINFVCKLGIRMLKFDSKYDIAVSYTNDIYKNERMIAGGANDVVVKKVECSKKIAWVHNYLNREGISRDIALQTYSHFDSIVNVSYDSKKEFDSIVPELTSKSFVVYNMFDIESIKELALEEQDVIKSKENIFNIVTVSRISRKQKRIDKILEVVKELNKNPDIKNKVRWYLVGSGQDMDFINEMIISNRLEKQIILLGQQDNPYKFVNRADILVLVSDYESYGMVIKEALILDTPVVSTSFSAAKEVLENGLNGIICSFDENSISNSIIEIMNRDRLSSLKKYIQNNPVNNLESIKQFYSLINDL